MLAQLAWTAPVAKQRPSRRLHALTGLSVQSYSPATMPSPSQPAAAPPNTPPGPPPPFLQSLRTLFTPTPPSTLISSMAPHILHPAILSSPHFSSRSPLASSLGASSSSLRHKLGWPSHKPDSTSVYIVERVDELCALEVPRAPFDLSPPPNARPQLEFPAPDAQVPLIRGFLATTPAAHSARLDRRRKRAGLGELALGLDGKLGLKERGEQARGLLGGGQGELGIGRKPKKSGRRKTEFVGVGHVVEEVEMSREELEKEAGAVQEDMSNVAVRRVSALLLLDGEVEVDEVPSRRRC